MKENKAVAPDERREPFSSALKFAVLFPITLLFVTGCSRPSSDAPSAATQDPPGARQEPAGLPTTKLAFPDGASITVEVADTPEAREKGLMFRRALSRDEGMLFVFPEEQMLQFWMKNTLVSLDMIWLDRERRVTGVHPEVPASREDTAEAELARRTGTGKFVLELAAGEAAQRGLKPGARLEFSWKDAPL